MSISLPANLGSNKISAECSKLGISTEIAGNKNKLETFLGKNSSIWNSFKKDMNIGQNQSTSTNQSTISISSATDGLSTGTRPKPSTGINININIGSGLNQPKRPGSAQGSSLNLSS